MTCRVLSIATLYPNAERPTFGTFVARQFEALAERGEWEVTVINPIGLPPVTAGRYAALARAASDGIEGGVQVLRPRFPLIPALSARWNPSLIARAVLPIARRLHADRPFDLVDAQFFYPDGPAAAKVARALCLPLSIKARGADIHYWGAQGFARRRMLDAARQATGLLAVSQALKADMVTLGMTDKAITVHYTGLDRTRFTPTPRAQARLAVVATLGVPPDGRLLVSVGALIPRKGQALALRALALLPSDVRLALAGTGADAVILLALAKELGLGERVHLLGSVRHDALPLLLSAADAMVLPAASEGLANAWVEALACGTPIVIADAGGARELVNSQDAGRIVARNPEAIAAGIAAVLAAAPPPKAVAATVEHFSWDANAAALAGYYDKLIANSPPACGRG